MIECIELLLFMIEHLNETKKGSNPNCDQEFDEDTENGDCWRVGCEDFEYCRNKKRVEDLIVLMRKSHKKLKQTIDAARNVKKKKIK